MIRRPTWWFAAVAVSIPLGFVVDGYCNSSTQWILAALAWWTLIGAVAVCTPTERAQVLLLVVLATGAELTFSLVLDWYTYRLENVPPWIPPAHGIVFLTALLWTKQPVAIRHQAAIRAGVTVAAIAYGLLALAFLDDVAGALGVALLLVWLWAFGPERGRFYAMMWLVVCYLELCGVGIGTWSWAPAMPLLGLSEANPPSGIVGIYGFFDLTALMLAGAVMRRLPHVSLLVRSTSADQ